MADNEVVLSVNVDTSNAEKNLKSFEKNSQNVANGVSGAFTALKGIAVAAVAVFAAGKVADFFADGIAAAEAQETSMTQLAQQLRLTGEYSETALTSFAAFADEMEKTSKYGDDVVISQLAVAKSFGVSNEQAEKLVKGAIELSAATGDNLESSVKKLGATLSGSAGSLSKQVPALKGLTQASLQAGGALDIILDRFAGSSAAEMQTFGGSLTQLKNSFGKLKESIGGAIVQSPTVIAGIQALNQVFQLLQSYVDNNREAIDSFVTGAVQAMATAIPVAVGVLGNLIKGLQVLLNVGSLAFSTLLSIVAGFGRAWQATFGVLYDVLFDLVKGFVDVANMIPGVGTALGAMGVNLDDVSQSIDGFHKGFDNAIETGLTGVESLSDSTLEFAANNESRFDSFNEGFQGFATAIDGVAQQVFDADGKVVASAKSVTAARIEETNKIKLTASELAKLANDAAKLEQDITTASLTEMQKVVSKRDEQQAQITNFYNQGVIDATKAAALRETVEKTAITNLEALRDAAATKAIEDAKKVADETRAAIESASANPFTFVVSKLKIDPSANKALGEGLGASIGGLNKVLDGAAGAKAAVAEGAGAIADAFMPGIGGAVGPLISKLAEGPDAVKSFIKGFVDGVPDIITAVAESIPVVVESLVDSLITRGGLIKIVIALGKAMLLTGPKIFMALGKSLFGGIKFDGLGAGFGGGILKGAQKLFEFDKIIRLAIFGGFYAGFMLLVQFDKKFRATIINAGLSLFRSITGAAQKLFDFDKMIRVTILNAAQGALNKFLEFDARLRAAAIAAAQSLFDGISNAVQKLFEFEAKIRETLFNAANTIFQKIKEAASKLFEIDGKIRDAIKNGLSKLFETPPWLQNFMDTVEKLTSFSFGGGGGSSPGAKVKKFVTGHAHGITDIPPGYPNDSYFAGLTSGERVVSADTNSDLKTFLASAKGGGATDGQVAALLGAILTEMQKLNAAPDKQAPLEFKIDNQVLGRAILNLNRRNVRLTA